MEKEPDDIIWLAEATGSLRKSYSWPAVTGKKPKKKFGLQRRAPKETGRWSEQDSRNFVESGPLDFQDVPEALARIDAATRQADKFVEEKKPQPAQGLTIGSYVTTIVWVGRRGSFAPRKFNPSLLRPLEGELAPLQLRGPINAAMLEEALSSFDTPGGRLRAAERHEQMIEKVAESSTVLHGEVKLKKPIALKRPGRAP